MDSGQSSEIRDPKKAMQDLINKIDFRGTKNNNHGTPHMQTVGKYLKDLVYGGLDGLITTFAVVSGVSGASLNTSIILILGFANLLADGFSMAVGNYLGTKSEIEFARRERRLTQDCVAHKPETVVLELINIYSRKGFRDFISPYRIGYSGEELKQLLLAVTSNERKLCADILMFEKLGGIEEGSAIMAALATFISFFICGLIPLIPYIYALYYPAILANALQLAVSMTALAIFSMGALRSQWTGSDTLWSGLEMLLIGGGAATLAYGVAHFFEGLNWSFAESVVK